MDTGGQSAVSAMYACFDFVYLCLPSMRRGTLSVSPRFVYSQKLILVPEVVGTQYILDE